VDLATITPLALAGLLHGHDAVINPAGFVADGDRLVTQVERVISAVEAWPADAQPVFRFLADTGLLALDNRGRRGLDFPKVRETYWPHAKNHARLQRSALDWRLLCPGPMTESDPVGVPRLRISRERLAVVMPALTNRLPGRLILPLFVRRMPQMIVSCADAAALRLAQLAPDSLKRHHRWDWPCPRA
jgi:hypothetical protein